MYLQDTKSNFDFTLRVLESNDGLAACIEYNACLLEAVTVRRIIDTFNQLLIGIVDNPDRTLMDLPLLSDSERLQLLAGSSDAACTDETTSPSGGDTRPQDIALKKLRSARRKSAGGSPEVRS
jgi:non-ribosomal peptide synthetase component F